MAGERRVARAPAVECTSMPGSERKDLNNRAGGAIGIAEDESKEAPRPWAAGTCLLAACCTAMLSELPAKLLKTKVSRR